MGLFSKKNYNGITKKTPENLQLDAGAFFKNFDPLSDTYQSAKEAGKIIGATDGGGSFVGKPTIRQVTVDGAGTRVMGFANVDAWEGALSFTLKEMTKDALRDALALADINPDGVDLPEGYDAIVPRMSINNSDYIQNVTWIGCLSGSDKPIMIVLNNAFNEDGITLNVQDKSESSIACTFYGYNSIEEYMNDEVKPPFTIYRPKTKSELEAESEAAKTETENSEESTENSEESTESGEEETEV